MNNKELLFSEGFQKFSKALGNIFYLQINSLSDLCKQKDIDLYEIIRRDWVKGYIIGTINFYYQLSSYNKFSDGYFYIIAGLFGSYKIVPAKDKMADYKDMFAEIEKKIDQQDNDLAKGFKVGFDDSEINYKNKDDKKAGKKISLQRYLLKVIKETDK